MKADRPANTGDSARRNRPSPIHSQTGAVRRLLVCESGSVDVLEHAARGFRFFVEAALSGQASRTAQVVREQQRTAVAATPKSWLLRRRSGRADAVRRCGRPNGSVGAARSQPTCCTVTIRGLLLGASASQGVAAAGGTAPRRPRHDRCAQATNTRSDRWGSAAAHLATLVPRSSRSDRMAPSHRARRVGRAPLLGSARACRTGRTVATANSPGLLTSFRQLLPAVSVAKPSSASDATLTASDPGFPGDRSWLLSTLWDDDWTCTGGSSALIDGFLRHTRSAATRSPSSRVRSGRNPARPRRAVIHRRRLGSLADACLTP
jgi:hypothetical protein